MYPLFRFGFLSPDECKESEHLGKISRGWKPLLVATKEHKSWQEMKRYIRQFGIIIDEYGRYCSKYKWQRRVVRETLKRKNKDFEGGYQDFDGFNFQAGWFI